MANVTAQENPAQEAGGATLGLDAKLDSSFQLITRGTAPGDFPNMARFNYRAEDISAEQLLPAGRADIHRITLDVQFTTPNANAAGWLLNSPTKEVETGFQGTLVLEGSFDVLTDNVVGLLEVEGVARFTLSRTIGTRNEVVVEQPFMVRVAPQLFANLERGHADVILKPTEIGRVEILLTNLDFYPGSFTLRAALADAPGITGSQIPIMGTGDYYLQPGETRRVVLAFEAPRELLWYNSIQTVMTISVQPTEGGGIRYQSQLVTVSGVYMDPGMFILLLAFLVLLILLIWLIIFARRAYDRTYLGRPVPPWTIPEEKVQLERLKKQDPRAFYVLRYFLMEEEYRSALMWFFAYKKLSKKQLKQEARAFAIREQADELVSDPRNTTRFEKAHARLQRRYEARIRRRQRRVERRILRLQRKLEKNHEKEFKKQHEKWEKKVEKIKAKANKPYVREKKKWEKEKATLVARHEKPYRRQLKRYEKKLEKAKERYEIKVKKLDKPTWKAWRKEHKGWEKEMKVRQKEGLEPIPEPALLSQEAGPPDYPKRPEIPPPPKMRPEPKPVTDIQLPPEPKLVAPRLINHKRYTRKARRFERKGWRKIRATERDLGVKLEKLRVKQGEAGVDVEKKRQKLITKAERKANNVSFTDRVLRRTPEKMALLHHREYVRSVLRHELADFEENEAAHLERVRLDGVKKQADIEARLMREAGALAQAKATEDEDAITAQEKRIEALETELAQLRTRNRDAFKEEQAASKARIEAKAAELKQREEELLQKEEASSRPRKPAAKPTRS